MGGIKMWLDNASEVDILFYEGNALKRSKENR